MKRTDFDFGGLVCWAREKSGASEGSLGDVRVSVVAVDAPELWNVDESSCCCCFRVAIAEARLMKGEVRDETMEGQ